MLVDVVVDVVKWEAIGMSVVGGGQIGARGGGVGDFDLV